MSTFKSAGDHYRRAILAAALVGGTVAAGVAAYLAFTRKKSAEPKSKKDKVVKEPTTSDVKDEMLSVRQPVKVDISRASPSDTSLQLSTDPLASPPLSLDSPTSIEIISMTESMGPDSLMMSSDFVQLDASANASLQSTPPLLEAIPDEETLSTEHLKIKDENDIVVIEDQRHTRDEKSSEDKEESSPSLSDTHIGGEEESSGSGTVKIEPEDDSTVGGESSKGSNSDIEVLEHPQDESLETIDSDNTDTEAKTPIPESSPALPEAPVESVTEETVHASIPVDTSERPATPEPVEQSTDATQEDVPSDSDVDVTTVTEEETLGDGQETLPYEEKHTNMHPTEDHFEDESLVSHIKITHPKDVETLLSFGMKLRTRKQQDNKYICKHYIESVAENSTAAQIGLCDNDELVCLNNMSVSSWSHSVLVEQLRVLPAEQFELTVSSSGATHRLKVHLKAEAEGVNVGSESFDISGQQITPDHLPVLTYQAGQTGPCVLEYKADGTFVHVSEDGLEVCTLCNDDPNSTPSTPALVACDALTFDVSDTDDQAVVIRGSVAMDSLFVTALSYTQLGLQRKERLAEDFETLRHPDPRVFYKHALSDDAICLESSQIRGFYIASDGRKVFLKDMATLESCEHDPQVQFQLSCPEVK